MKFALIGCGHWGQNYIKTFQSIEGVELNLVYDIDKERVLKLKEKFSNIEVVEDVVDIWKDKSVEAVIIATPAYTHYSIGRTALSFEKHVLMEKPLALEAQQAVDLVLFARRMQKVLMPGHIFEHNDAVKKIKEIIASKELGDIYYLYSQRLNLGPIRNDVNAVWDLALHDVSVFNFILGSVPISVSSKELCCLRGNISDVGFIMLTYLGGISAHIHISWLDPRKIRYITIVGSKKMLVFNDLDYINPIALYDRSVAIEAHQRRIENMEYNMIVTDGEIDIPKINMREPLFVECLEFVQQIQDKKQNEEYVLRGVDCVRIMQAANLSQKFFGKEVKI